MHQLWVQKLANPVLSVTIHNQDQNFANLHLEEQHHQMEYTWYAQKVHIVIGDSPIARFVSQDSYVQEVK